MPGWGLVGVYGLPLLVLWACYAIARSRRSRRSQRALAAAREAGLTEPSSLHPVIDPALCIGCGTCAGACPEEEVLGLLDGKAVLVNPASCIGHGACADACPQDAISLVLGTETRGVDIPVLGPDFQTGVPGIFVAGELGGMGLIRNAVEQGRQAVESVRAFLAQRARARDALDLVIVGAGPAGFAASLAARKHGLRFATLEQDTLGGTVAHYPRGKIVMTAPVDLPLYGVVRLRETTKEALLALWQDVERSALLRIRYEERVESVVRTRDGFTLETTRGKHAARAVLLALGRRGTPRKLGVPGEESEKVVYRLIDPEQYRGRRVLVVGGGDSALEAATSLAAEEGTEVALSYRSGAFSRAKPKNRERVAAAESTGRLRVLLGSEVVAIADDHVRIRTGETEIRLANDCVIVCAGGILPTAFLRSMGIEIETRHGEA